MDRNFWDKVYESKAEDAVSWYQEIPLISLEQILSLKLPTTTEIVDIGGGRSKLAENLFLHGYKNITVLDISSIAIEKLNLSFKKNIPDHKIETINSNVIETKFPKHYDIWHDRAVFHFLTNPEDQKKYVEQIETYLSSNGFFLIFTFSKSGPQKCSGLDICQYEVQDLKEKFSNLKLIRTISIEHQTPFNTIQNFTYCLFKKN